MTHTNESPGFPGQFSSIELAGSALGLGYASRQLTSANGLKELVWMPPGARGNVTPLTQRTSGWDDFGVTNSAAADAGFIGPRIGKSGFTTPEEFAQASYMRYQNFVDDAYVLGLAREAQGLLRGNPNTRLGDFVDRQSAARFRQWLAYEGIPEGPGQFVQMNRWLRDPTGSGLYVRPDIRIPSANTILDATVGMKYPTDPQIMRFGTYSSGDRIIIVRPEQRGSYSIWP